MSEESRQIVVEKCLSPDGVLRRTRIRWDEGGTITGVAEVDGREKASGHMAVPGLIDSHIHGFAGVDFLLSTVPEPEEWLRADAALWRRGVTGYVPTFCSSDVDAISRLARSVNAASPDGFLGLYSEGPFVNPRCAGALPREQIRDAVDIGHCREMLAAAGGLVRIMMVSPELPGACDLVELLREHDVTPAIGHSHADLNHTRNAVDAGALRATHWPNAMRWGDHHDLGIALALLTDDRIFLEVIGDNTHVSGPMMEIAARCKGDRLICISDCLFLGGIDHDPDTLLKSGLEVTDGRIVLAGTDTHCGASMSLDRCFDNLRSTCGFTLDQAVSACSTRVAASLGLSDRGEIAIGKRADFAVLDEGGRVGFTYRKGIG